MGGADPEGERKRRERFDSHWMWFGAIFAVLFTAGVFLAFFAMLPLAMATDGCHDGSTDRVCSLTARGQNALVWIPWAVVCVGAVASVGGAFLATRIRWSPLLGVAIGVAAAAATIPLGEWIAFQV
ncbi:hypothetical protein ACTXG7_28685 [Mycolicibacterium sp. Dal123E01]|uniref:hypothetical protein n=1 Tax=Mycolicibacterium sp. Dal123E01 TaxID=3457578 RepID=UPI00403EAF03